MKRLSVTTLLGVSLSTEKKDYILLEIIKGLKYRKDKFYIVTPNPELIMIALKDKEYRSVLNQAQWSLSDGIGVLMAARFLGLGIKSRLTGVDFMQELVSKCAEQGLTTGFFGAAPGVAVKTSSCLKKIYPNLKVVYENDKWDIRELKGKHIDMLFVALGSPKQEKWIAKNLSNLPVTSAMGVGGAFDFLSGSVPRAPKIMRSIGLEWLFRLIIQPWRFKRQKALPMFVFKVLQERFSPSK